MFATEPRARFFFYFFGGGGGGGGGGSPCFGTWNSGALNCFGIPIRLQYSRIFRKFVFYIFRLQAQVQHVTGVKRQKTCKR